MSRYIDADALMNQWCDEMCKPKPSCEADCAMYDYVRLAPSIDIVRCKECKRRYRSGYRGDEYWVCDFMDAKIKADDFCSYGERGGE